jgi:hypothetical protein
MIHTVFGYTLMAAGAARIIEIAFVLRDRSAVTNDLEDPDPNSFQYLTPFLLIAGGFMFMGATEEQMQMLADANVTHVSYVLILFSMAFLMFLCKYLPASIWHFTNMDLQSPTFSSISTLSTLSKTRRAMPRRPT